MDIITGYTGSPHVTAEQDRDINIGIFGNESYVLQTGSQLTAEVSSNNEIKVRDGVIMHQGCAASIKKNTYDSLTITNGSQGMKRVDLIVARYSRDPSTNEESLTLKVIQGTPSENSPTVPGYTTGDIQSGDLVADMPLYQVILNGLNITEVKKLFSVQGSIAELSSKLKNAETTINNNLTVTKCSFALNSSNINTSTQYSRVQCFKIGHIAFINGVIKINKAINAYSQLRIGTGFPKLHSSYSYNAYSSSFPQDGTYASCFAEINKNGDLDLAVRFQKAAAGDIFYINMCYICQ